MPGRGCTCGSCRTCYQREWHRAYYRRPGVAGKLREKARLNWSKNKPTRVRKSNSPYSSLEDSARQAVSRALKRGDLTRFPCESCGAVESQAHHDDYEKPLEVKWLCPSCHGIEHRRIL